MCKRRDKPIHIFVSDKEKKAIRQLADDNFESMSAYIRQILLKEIANKDDISK